MVDDALDKVRDFEGIKQNVNGNDGWSARDLMPLLGYDKWENFTGVIGKAEVACKRSGYAISDHFRKARKMVEVGSNTVRPIDDYLLSRYACYLIAQNGS